MADIKSMFYQVKVPEEDTDLLRFLWWPEGDLSREGEEFRMTVHLFWCYVFAQLCLLRLMQNGR